MEVIARHHVSVCNIYSEYHVVRLRGKNDFKTSKEDGWSDGYHSVGETCSIHYLNQWHYTFNYVKKEYTLIMILHDLRQQQLNIQAFHLDKVALNATVQMQK
jgi:hypothetical protein